MRFLFIALLTLFSASALRAAAPNIIFILADDLGYTDVATFGSQYYETPNIDKLATQGVKLTSHHHCQNCQPTRAALMSGQYAPRTGVYTVGDIGRFEWQTRPLKPVANVTSLPLEKITIAQSLKKAGYATGMFGKWHLGQKEEYHPSKRGFDEAIVSSGKHFDFKTDPAVDYPKGQYLADFLTDKAVNFIQRHKAEPFFLYLPHYGVHAPHQAKPELIEKFKAKPGVGGHNDPVYAAMIASVDESVGRVMAELEKQGIADNTLLIFASDNGGVGGYQREGIKASDTTDNAPLRCGKGSLYEGGIRVPFIARWPGVITAGTKTDTPTIHVDLYPTLLEIAKAPAPENYPLDGESLAPLFRDPKAALKRTSIFQHFPGYLGSGDNTWRTKPVGLIQQGPWKLMEFFEDHHLELYNLDQDIGETHNLAAEKPEKVKELQSQMVLWRESIGAKMPTPNTPSEAPKKKGQGKKKKKMEED